MNTRLARMATGLFLLAGFMTLTANAGKVFKWIDERGTTHYSSRPPKIEVDTQVINMSGVPDELFSEISEDAKDSSEDTSNDSSEAQSSTPAQDSSESKKSADVIAYCKRIQKNLKTLQSEKQVQMQQEDGTIEVLGEAAREREMVRLQEQIKKFCT